MTAELAHDKGMKMFKQARGPMMVLALALSMGCIAPEVIAADGVQSQAQKDVNALAKDMGANPVQNQADKDVEALKKRQQQHADEYMKMLSKTVNGSKATNADTGKGMEKYMPTVQSFQKETNTTLTKLSIGDLMTQGESCMSYNWMPVPALQGICCIAPCPRRWGNYISACRRTGCWLNHKGWAYDIEYWEPSAIIEVSCRSGYSMLKPSGVGTRGTEIMQSCVGNNKPGNGRRFYEARIWAINGYDGQLRHQSALGSTNGQRMMQCSEYSDPGDTKASRYWGYGRNKEKTFSHPDSNGSGPGGSWEAYISDKDPAWANDSGGTSMPEMGVCDGKNPDVESCWGSMNPSGWVTHTNPRIAAATVAWRAHTKALGMRKVSGPGKGGYQMMMDFPFQKSGAAGAEMGLAAGGKKGSKCFKPGDPGPTWYGGYTPEALADKVQSLKNPQLTTVAEEDSGLYVFTVWVQTKCRRWVVKDPGPAGICRYEDKS